MTVDFFTHGQLYVSLSRVGSAKHVKIFKPKSSPSFGFMKNVVYQEVLSLNIQSHPSPTDFNDSSLKESKPLFPLGQNTERDSYADQKALLTIPRLDGVGFKLRELTQEDGNCFIWAALDQMRYICILHIEGVVGLGWVSFFWRGSGLGPFKKLWAGSLSSGPTFSLNIIQT